MEEFYDTWQRTVGAAGQGDAHSLRLFSVSENFCSIGDKKAESAPDAPLSFSPVLASLASSLAALLEHDQLSRERALGHAFHGFEEGAVAFPPTFKYDVGSARLDSSKKARCPAWTDRILFCSLGNKRKKKQAQNNKDNPDDAGTKSRGLRMGRLQLKLRDYYSVEVRSSDHRPVCAEFQLSD